TGFPQFTFPDDGRLVLPDSLEVTVHAVIRRVQLAVDEPLGERRIPFQDLIPFLKPVQAFRLSRPKSFQIFASFFIKAEILGVSLGYEFGRGMEDFFALSEGYFLGNTHVHASFDNLRMMTGK